MSNSRKKNLFTQVPVAKVKRNLFDLSHEVKMSGKFGYLYPVLCVDTLPGDTFRERMNVMLRFAPLVAPVMHRFDVTTHFFFVPYRLLWDNWEDFITGGQDGTEEPVMPYYTPAGVVANAGVEPMQAGSIWDYLGLPLAPGSAPAAWSTERINALPIWAVTKVWNDFYRDPNLNLPAVTDGGMPIPTELDGDVSADASAINLLYGLTAASDYSYLRRGFEKDYFTSALPFAQRGAQVLMPLAGEASFTYLPQSEVRDATGNLLSGVDYIGTDEGLLMSGGAVPNNPFAGGQDVRLENLDEITIDGATTTINDFRRALAIQRWLEVNARGGARYVEQIEGHFNVRVPDYRLQRAEYLGGGRQPVQISEVLQTAPDVIEGDSQLGVGELFGHGISVGSTNRFTYRCQEHGVVLGFLSVTMRTAYQQGIPKLFLRRDKFDFAFPELARLGEQEILSKEVFFSYAEADATANNGVFGYIPRYAEYKFHNDRMAGDFRTNLNFWHEGRIFTERPSLDVGFTTIYEKGDSPEEPDVLSASEYTFRRIFNVVGSDQDYLWMQLYHHLTAKRPLPYFGVPSIV